MYDTQGYCEQLDVIQQRAARQLLRGVELRQACKRAGKRTDKNNKQ